MRLTFGKHNGKTLTEVFAIPASKSDKGGGKGYLKWVMGETEDDVLRGAIEKLLNGNSMYKGKPKYLVETKDPKQPDSAVWEAKDRMNMGQSAMRSATEQVAAEITAGIIKTKKAIDERWDELYTQRTFILEAAKNGQKKEAK